MWAGVACGPVWVAEVAVIIPFFQRERGILGRALASVMGQQLPVGWSARVIVIDDGSPYPAADDAVPFLKGPHRVDLLWQMNKGVAAARNFGLDLAAQTATLIAFLDSDDAWPAGHLARAIAAHKAGFDLTFADNSRVGHHESHIALLCPDTRAVLAAAQTTGGVSAVPSDELVGLVLKEFPTQASTVVYRLDVAPRLRFDTGLQSAGEDVLFFAALAAAARRPGFDTEGKVKCGPGVNIYFGNLSWDSPKYLGIKLDQYLAHRRVARTVAMSGPVKRWNETHIRRCEEAFAFHLLRNLAKRPGRVPAPVGRLLRTDPVAVLMLPITMTRLALRSVAAAVRMCRWRSLEP